MYEMKEMCSANSAQLIHQFNNFSYFVIVLEPLCVVDADIVREWKIKPGQKICHSCEKAINNVIKIAPTDDRNIGDIVGKNTEGYFDISKYLNINRSLKRNISGSSKTVWTIAIKISFIMR